MTDQDNNVSLDELKELLHSVILFPGNIKVEIISVVEGLESTF